MSADFDGITQEDEYRRLSNNFRSELTDIMCEMENVKQEKGESIASAECLLELNLVSTKEKRSLPGMEVTFLKVGVPYRI